MRNTLFAVVVFGVAATATSALTGCGAPSRGNGTSPTGGTTSSCGAGDSGGTGRGGIASSGGVVGQGLRDPLILLKNIAELPATYLRLIMDFARLCLPGV